MNMPFVDNMHFTPGLFVVTVLFVLALQPSPARPDSSEASARCPSEAKGWDYDGLLLCVPAGDDRYRLGPDGTEWMAWSGDDPIPFPATEDPVPSGDEEKLDMTIARIWLGEKNVGVADRAKGQNGFDRFMEVVSTSALRAAQQSTGESFTAAIPVDEAGRQQEFQFNYLQTNVLKGERKVKDQPGPDFIVFRWPSEDGQNRVLMCSGSEKGSNPGLMCLGIVTIGAHRAGAMIAGRSVERSFRIFEELTGRLESFVVRP